MNRLLVVSRTRSDIDLRECLGKYEFTVTPPLLFFPDGTLHTTKDKSVVAEELYKLQEMNSNENMDIVDDLNRSRMASKGEEVRKIITVDGSCEQGRH